MLVKIYGSAVFGVEASTITIEVNIDKGIGYHLVGLPDIAIKESNYRIAAALQNNGYKIPGKKITINMAPADMRKEGSAYDLSFAIGILAANGQIQSEELEKYIIMGELSLDGGLQPIKGALPIAIQARKEGFKGFILPKQNAKEAAIVDNLDVYGVENIKEVIDFFNGEKELQPIEIDTRKEFYRDLESPEFDFADMDNPAGEQLFNEVVGSLSAAFSNYTNDPSKGNRMSRIQGDQIGFAQALSKAVDDGYQWRQDRGLEIVKTAIMSIEYDEDTKLMMKDVKRADALSGTRGNSFMQQSVARGMQAAGETGGGANMAFMGMGMGAAGNVMGGMQQPNNPGTYQPGFGQQPQQPNDQMHGQHPNDQMYGQQPQQPVDPTAKLIEMKKLLDAGVITQEEFDRIKMQLLGL